MAGREREGRKGEGGKGRRGREREREACVQKRGTTEKRNREMEKYSDRETYVVYSLCLGPGHLSQVSAPGAWRKLWCIAVK